MSSLSPSLSQENTSDDLLCRLLNSFFDRNYPPDALSIEWIDDDNEEDKMVIRLAWNTGLQRDYAYTEQRYKQAFGLFNRRWKALKN